MQGPALTERVLRGGSWINNNERKARCSYRNNDHPANFNNNNGFRLVCVPIAFGRRAGSAVRCPTGVDGQPAPDERSGGRAGPVPGWSAWIAKRAAPQPNIETAPLPVVGVPGAMRWS
jgi:hypothetical protein